MGSKIPLLLPCPLSNVHCHLVYANVVWSSAKDSALKPLYLKQKAAVRIISSSSYNSHTEPIFKSLKILPLPKLSEFFKLQFFQQFKQGLLPSALKNIWSTHSEYNPDRLHCLRNDDDIRNPISRLNQFNKFHCIISPHYGQHSKKKTSRFSETSLYSTVF